MVCGELEYFRRIVAAGGDPEQDRCVIDVVGDTAKHGGDVEEGVQDCTLEGVIMFSFDNSCII